VNINGHTKLNNIITHDQHYPRHELGRRQYHHKLYPHYFQVHGDTVLVFQVLIDRCQPVVPMVFWYIPKIWKQDYMASAHTTQVDRQTVCHLRKSLGC